MRYTIFSITIALSMSAWMALGQKPLTEEQKRHILENQELFLSYNILLSDYTFEDDLMNNALLRAVKYHDSARTLKKAGWIVTGSGLGLIALGAAGVGLLATESEGGLVAGTIFIVSGISIGLPLVCVGTPMLIVGGSDKKQMLKAISVAQQLQRKERRGGSGFSH
ncbi:MAG: hypothetical protein RMJ33_09170 [Saprospiraceae bacterium]|nr:hypothetical protein [Saprospiraceae bacterium]MDW8229994.1 hypothetical protein [Saprospiraceae bacterium]